MYGCRGTNWMIMFTRLICIDAVCDEASGGEDCCSSGRGSSRDEVDRDGSSLELADAVGDGALASDVRFEVQGEAGSADDVIIAGQGHSTVHGGESVDREETLVHDRPLGVNLGDAVLDAIAADGGHEQYRVPLLGILHRMRSHRLAPKPQDGVKQADTGRDGRSDAGVGDPNASRDRLERLCVHLHGMPALPERKEPTVVVRQGCVCRIVQSEAGSSRPEGRSPIFRRHQPFREQSHLRAERYAIDPPLPVQKVAIGVGSGIRAHPIVHALGEGDRYNPLQQSERHTTRRLWMMEKT